MHGAHVDSEAGACEGHGDNDGFTLIELLIVVAIIGIIAAIAVPGLLARPHRGERSVGDRVASRHQQREPQLDDQLLRAAGDMRTSWPILGIPPTTRRPAVHQPRPFGDGPVTKSGYEHHLCRRRRTSNGSHDVLDGHRRRTRATTRCAAPAAPNTTGVRYFGTNENQTLFEEPTPAPRRSRLRHQP